MFCVSEISYIQCIVCIAAVYFDILHFQYFKLLRGRRRKEGPISTCLTKPRFFFYIFLYVCFYCWLLPLCYYVSTRLFFVLFLDFKHHIHCIILQITYRRKWHFLMLVFSFWNKLILNHVMLSKVRPSQTLALHEVKSHVGKHHKSDDKTNCPLLQI